MDVGLYTDQGKFLKAEEVKTLEEPKRRFLITNEGEFIENKFGNTRLHLVGEINKETKKFDCSPSNAKMIEDTFGSETKNWVGKMLILETYRIKTSKGEMTDAINIVKAIDPNKLSSQNEEKVENEE